MVVLKLTDQVHICTLSDLPLNALRLDVTPGNYELRTHEGGYIFIKEGVDINNVKVVKVFNNRDGEYGLSGTYHDGDSSDVEQCRLFNDHFWKYIIYMDWKKWKYTFYEDCFDYYEPYDSSDDGYDRFENELDELDDEDDEDDLVRRMIYNYYERTRHRYQLRNREPEEGFDERLRHAYLDRWKYSDDESSDEEPVEPPRKRPLIKLPCYHNLPFLFYLSKPVQNLRNVDLKLLPTQIKEDIFVWEVNDGGDNVGYVVKSPFLHNMMGDQAGIAVYQGATAFGNFEPNEDHALDEDVFYPHKDYICDIKPCNCRTIYPNIRYRPNTKQI